MEIVDRFFKPSNQSFFLFGPRGTGKSTLLKHYFNDAMYIDLLDPEAYRNFSAKPERLGEMIEANPNKERLKIKNVLCVPCEEFLMKLAPGKKLIDIL